MRIFLLILALLITQVSAWALKLPLHKTKAAQLLVINEDILIQGKFTNNQGDSSNPNSIFDLKIAIHIPHDQKYLTITTLYDEINENPIEQITWIIDNGKNKPATRIKAYKIDQIINQNIESLAMEYNPTLAYDRMHSNKHIINRTFYYDQAAIFGNKNKTPMQFLELYIPGSKGVKTKSIRIDDRLYQPTVPSNPASTARAPMIMNNSNPMPNQTQSLEVEDDADADAIMQNAMQQLNDIRGNNPNSSNINPHDQQMQQLQQMQQQMQVDSLGDEGEDEDSFNDDAEEDAF